MIDRARVLVHLATGIGNIVLATPLLLALRERLGAVDLLLHADYAGVDDLFRGWSALGTVFDGRAGEFPPGPYDVFVPAIPPFAWPRFAAQYRGRTNIVPRPPDALFYLDEQGYYIAFAEQLGWQQQRRPECFLPVAPASVAGITTDTLILAPGCKTGQMAKKRWPHFPALAELFRDVVVVGTLDDLVLADGKPMRFASHVRSLIGDLSLKELAGVLAAGGAVVANDSGIGHMAAAAGVYTVLVFGPTPDTTLGALASNVTVLRSGLSCEPCWLSNRFAACASRITCLSDLSAARVAAVLPHITRATEISNAL
jgi:ADP-heptose:LPS heptosyltransferase